FDVLQRINIAAHTSGIFCSGRTRNQDFNRESILSYYRIRGRIQRRCIDLSFRGRRSPRAIADDANRQNRESDYRNSSRRFFQHIRTPLSDRLRLTEKERGGYMLLARKRNKTKG